MTKAGLTKGQRRRANERLRKQSAKLFDETMGPAPAPPAELADNLDTPPDSEPWERAPAHMVEYDECPALREEKLKDLSASAATVRTDERNAQANALKLKYRDLWNRRSGAKIIASLETHEGNPLSERTVQRLFKITGN